MHVLRNILTQARDGGGQVLCPVLSSGIFLESYTLSAKGLCEMASRNKQTGILRFITLSYTCYVWLLFFFF